MSDGPTSSEVPITPRPPYGSLIAAWAAAFVAGGCVMIVETLAFRLVARYLGYSNYTVSTIIGVVLGGLAIGNYVGGRLADRYRPDRVLSILFILASFWCFVIPVLNDLVGEWPALWYVTLPLRIGIHVVLTFAIPSTVLGTISPVVAKMALDQGRAVGRTVGGVSAWGVIGSIVGTILTGFVLIVQFDLYTIDYIVAAVLAIMAVLYGSRSWLPRVWALLAGVLILIALSPWTRALAIGVGLREYEGEEVFFDKASEYSQVRVVADSSVPGRRVMLLDKLAHSFYNPNQTDDLLYGYEKVYAAITESALKSRNEPAILILGGGGYTHPRHILQRRPDTHLEVVEIDRVVTEAAMAAFGLSSDPRLHIVHLDARQRVAQLVRQKRDGENIRPFDLVFLDALNDFNVPFHLTTLEFERMVKELLSPDGAYLMNLIDIFNEGKYLAAQIETTRQVFKHVDCFYANEAELGQGLDPTDRNTFVIVASDRDLDLKSIEGNETGDEMRRMLLPQSMLEELRQRVQPQVLTDDYAPTEFLMNGVVEKSGRKDAPARLFNRGNRLEAQGRIDEAAYYYEQALRIEPRFFLAHINLGILRVSQKRYDEAIASFQRAAEIRPASTAPIMNMGSVYMMRGDNERAVDAFRRVVAVKPEHVDAWYSMGYVLGRLGRWPESRDAFLRVLAIDAAYPDAARYLAEVEAALSDAAASRPANESNAP